MVNIGPIKSAAALAYEQFEAKYPEAMREKFDSIFKIENEVEKQAAFKTLTDEERMQYDVYIADLLKLEKTFYKSLIIDAKTETAKPVKPILYRANNNSESECSSCDDDTKKLEVKLEKASFPQL